MHAVPPQLDHLVFAGPNLRDAIDYVEEMLGVSLLPGGRHAAWGTANALLPLGPSTYLEVIGPDPDASRGKIDLFGISSLRRPRLVTWVAKANDLSQVVRQAKAQGIELGSVSRGSRNRPDGSTLNWELTDPFANRSDGILPFFIDWGSGPHPAAMAPATVNLLSLRAEHPDPSRVAEQLTALQLDLKVDPGPSPRLVATFQSSAGPAELS